MRNSTALNITLWVLQVLLALFFALASGLPKFILPPDQLNMPIPLPTLVVRLIGTCEILGALGLVLPGVLRSHTRWTPRAALGLFALTLCATVYQFLANQPGSAIFALVLGLVVGAVGYARWRIAPLRDNSASRGPSPLPGQLLS